MGDYRVVPDVEIAGWIRRDLKAAFPFTKFSVRKSSHGSIYVRWTDGPSSGQVNRYASRYDGKGFDGMTDSTTYKAFVLSPDGERVKSYTWSFTQRHTSPEAEAKVRAYLEAMFSEQDRSNHALNLFGRYLHRASFGPTGAYAFVEVRA